MVAEEIKTASLASASATPSLPNRMVSVCAALTTTLTTMPAPLVASAGVFAPLPPSLTKRATASADTSQPVTSKPARLSEVVMPKPIEPSPITATGGFSVAAIWRSLVSSLPALALAYHGLAALPKRETTQDDGTLAEH